MPDNVAIGHLSGLSETDNPLNSSTAPTFLSGGGVYIDFNTPRANPFLGDATASNTVISLLTGITASTSLQSVNVSYTGFMTTILLDYWIIEPGTANQEVVYVNTITDSTHFSAVFRRNHSAGAALRKVFTSYSKFIDMNISNVPINGVGNIGFIRRDPLPTGVYDQYRIRGSVGTFLYVQDDQVPWVSSNTDLFSLVPQYSPASLAASGNPSNGIAIDAGPQLGSGGDYHVTPSVQVQLLFTMTPELPISPVYRQYYDDL